MHAENAISPGRVAKKSSISNSVTGASQQAVPALSLLTGPVALARAKLAVTTFPFLRLRNKLAPVESRSKRNTLFQYGFPLGRRQAARRDGKPAAVETMASRRRRPNTPLQ
jgi:hypothetical protein